MTPRDLVIATSDGEKGRSFRASLLAYAEADHLWALGMADTDTRRPVFMMLACSDQEAAPFLANLRAGRQSEIVGGSKGYGRRNKGDQFELLRSGGYQYATQRHHEGVVITAFLPELFRLDPGMVSPDGCRFVMLPSQEWCLDPQPAALAHVTRCLPPKFERSVALMADVPALCRIAPLFAVYLDRRTRAPLIPDARFYAQVLVASVAAGLAQRSGGNDTYREDGVARVGLLPGLAFQAKHDELEAMLAEQVRMFDAMTAGRVAA